MKRLLSIACKGVTRKEKVMEGVCLNILSSKKSYITITLSGSSGNGGRAGHTSLCYNRAATLEPTKVISRLCLNQVLSFMINFGWLFHCLCRLVKRDHVN